LAWCVSLATVAVAGVLVIAIVIDLVIVGIGGGCCISLYIFGIGRLAMR